MPVQVTCLWIGSLYICCKWEARTLRTSAPFAQVQVVGFMSKVAAAVLARDGYDKSKQDAGNLLITKPHV